MANKLTARPIHLDATADSALTGPLKVTHVVLVGGSTDSTFRIDDQASTPSVLAQGSVLAKTTVVIPIGQMWMDMTLAAITGTGAVVLVYTR